MLRSRGGRALGPILGAMLAAASLLAATPVAAQLLPSGFFDAAPTPGSNLEVEADFLSYDANTREVSAEGNVVLYYDDQVLTADRVIYNRATGDVYAEGNVKILDREQNVYETDRLTLTENMAKAFLESLVLTTPQGAMVTATDADYERELVTILTDASYSPCGLCIDSKGRRIGWRVNATKFIHDREKALVYLEGASLELVGIPVAWLPWLAVPDPSQPRAQGFRLPSVDYDEKTGVRLEVPYFMPIGQDIDLLLSPTLMSRQGLLMSGSWTHRVPLGYYNVSASGIYQLDPMAFTFSEAQTNWRGSIQTSGEFRPHEDWVTGWSYTAFTDSAFLVDYDLHDDAESRINEVYVTYLTRDSYFDIRARQYTLLGNVSEAARARQALSLPTVEAAHYADLGAFGRVELYGRLLGVHRGADHEKTVNGVNYVLGYEGSKVHGTAEASWQSQQVLPGGILATPYLGVRLDAGYYDGTSALNPGEVSLLSATPIAAIDFRWPVMATDGPTSHLFEPVAQLVYRGSDTSLVGVTNDDAQSFVFDDTLLFSYNRFSGSNRQETGLRANVGGRYLADFGDGSWLQLMGGQSFHLAGSNALGVVDHAQTGNSSGLEGTASYLVLGAQGSPGADLNLGAKAQIDPATWQIMRAVAASTYQLGDYTFGGNYTYIPANPAVGTVADQHEATGTVAGPLPIDYWFADASLSWDLAQNSFLEATGGITYDDGFFVVGAHAGMTGATHSKPESLSFGVKFRLRGPGMAEWGF